MKRSILCIFMAAAILVCCAPSAGAFSISGVSAKAAVLIDAQTGTIISGKNQYDRLPMASTTKIMSALLLLESGDLDKEFRVDNDAILVEGSSMGLCPDDVVTKRSLCYGMLLPSGNDAANETAVLLAGSGSKFADMMNKRAEKLGMRDTHFVTPSGLHDDDHYSTAYDMAILTREALKNETFREICGTTKAKLRFGNPPYERWLVNTNKLLSLYDGCIGVKTGFTDEAGRCLVSAAERDGVTLICVTLNDPNDWNDHIKMYNYGFSQTKSVDPSFDFSELCVNVAGGDKDKVRIIPAEIPKYTSINGSMPVTAYEASIEKFIYAPVSKGKKAGIVRYYSDGVLIGTSDLVAAEECSAVIKEYKPGLDDKIVNWIKSILKKK